MSSSSPAYVDFVIEQLAPIKDLAHGRFFGGIGLTASSTQFAMVMGNSLYFVVDGSTRTQYEKMGSPCFGYNTKKGRVEVKKYFQVPGELLEEPAKLVALAMESIEVARKLKKPGKKQSEN